MTVYARSDIAAVSISQAHGGCAQGVHSRPVENGAPAKVWALTCPDGCEDFLRNDPHWSTTVSDIPETHDERLAREDFEKRGARDKDAIMTLALAKLAGIDPDLLPASLTTMVSGARAHVPQTVNCPQGHPNGLDARFCSQCGRGIGAGNPPVAAEAHQQARAVAQSPHAEDDQAFVDAIQSAPEPPAEPAPAPRHPEPPAPVSAPPKAAHVLPSNTKMRSMKVDELKEHAHAAGVDAGGTREQVLNRLIKHNNGKT